MDIRKALSFVVLAMLSAQAHADRWILKNPSTIVQSLKTVKTIDFGTTKYVVVETPQFSTSARTLVNAMRLKTLTKAEAAIPDLEIGVPAMKGPSTQEGAWHVDRLKFASIPKGLDGRGVIVAILDTGVDYGHSALAGHIWQNTKEIAGNGVDDDQNGYVDDINGFDFNSDKGDPMDAAYHGTHCAGIVAADTQAGGIARGVAQGVQIMPLRILAGTSSGLLSDATEGIKYAVDNGAKVLSNSWRIYKNWSNYYTDEGVRMMADAIRYADTKGAIFVAASGNESKDMNDLGDNPLFPAGMQGHPNLFVVGSTESGDRMSSFSNFGTRVVHVAAPGSDIISTIPGNGWTDMSGTSMAAPMVAGILALGLQNGYTHTEAMERLIRTSERLNGFDRYVMSGGIVNILDYLK